MKHRDVLNLTAADQASIVKWRRAMTAAVGAVIGLTLVSTDWYRRNEPSLIGVTAASAQAQAARLSQECAIRDGQYFMQLEEEGDRPGAAGDRYYRAFLAMLEARALCDAGRQKEAFALYDRAFGPYLAARSLTGTGAAADRSRRD